jgi:hypothetical protein
MLAVDGQPQEKECVSYRLPLATNHLPPPLTPLVTGHCSIEPSCFPKYPWDTIRPEACILVSDVREFFPLGRGFGEADRG